MTLPVRTGGCQCGAVRYEVTGAPVDLYVCHCTECRAQSASAFGISFRVMPQQVRVVSGALKRWSRKATVGGLLDCIFCENCGSRLFHGDLSGTEEISVKGGSLDEPLDLSAAKHIWTKSKLAGVIIPEGCKSWPQEPQ